MRVLIPGLCYEDSFVENVRVALEELGHEVRTFDIELSKYGSFPRQVWRVMRERLFGDAPRAEDLRVLRVAQDWKPELLLALTSDIHPEVLDELATYCKGRRVLWWADAPANSSRLGIVNPLWDHVYLK